MNVALMQHQKDGIDFVLKNKGVAALHWDPGCGKTLGSMSIYERMKLCDPMLKLLVICPISLIHGAWAKEIEKFTTYKYVDLHGLKTPCYKNAGFDIYLVNFEYLVSKKKFDDLKQLLASGSWMCVIDESSKMKNHQSVITSRFIGDWDKVPGSRRTVFVPGIKQFCKYRIELSGTPAPNIEWEYWAQMKFLDDSILGDNFFKFRNKYFNLQRGREIVPGSVFNKAALRDLFNNGYKYEFDERERQGFFDRLKAWCHVVKAKDCLDLPETVDEYRVFDMEGDQARVYKEMKTEYIAEIKTGLMKDKYLMPSDEIVINDQPIPNSSQETNAYAVANIVLTKMMKLRQVTSSFIITEDGVARPISTKIPEKVKILLDIVEEVGNEQIIVWGQFRWEIAAIVSALKDFGGVSELHGGVPNEKRIDHVNNFISGANRFLVAHPDSAAHGLTFVNCRYAVYFSLSYSYEEYEQSRKRIHRYGQRGNCVYYHILARHSVDEDVLAICQKKAGKQDIAERFMRS